VHVAVVGAGALGRIFGVRLAVLGKVDVDFVVRSPALRVGAIAIERVGGEGLALDAPSLSTEVPPHADVVIGCVRAHELQPGSDVLSMLQRGPSVPVVMMTPMLPRTYRQVQAALPGRLIAAAPSVTGYTNAAGVTRHWVSRSARTLLEDPRRPEPAVRELISALALAGIDAELALDAEDTSAATVIAVLPLFLAIDAAGSIDALLADGPLVGAMFRGLKQTRALAALYGNVPSWVSALDRFLGPVTLRVGLALGRRRSPEIVAFVERSFGRGARAQNVALAAEVVALAEEKGVACESVAGLAERLG
jgi:hypothetical protein